MSAGTADDALSVLRDLVAYWEHTHPDALDPDMDADELNRLLRQGSELRDRARAAVAVEPGKVTAIESDAVSVLRDLLALLVNEDAPDLTPYWSRAQAVMAAASSPVHQCDIDAGGNCRDGCGYNSDQARSEATLRGEDVYEEVVDSDTLPCPDETCGYCGRPPVEPPVATIEWVLDLRRATHPVRVDMAGVWCSMCGDPATHKVGEEVDGSFHNLTNYLCCRHFTVVVWDCEDFPYAAGEQVPEVDYSAEYSDTEGARDG